MQNDPLKLYDTDKELNEIRQAIRPLYDRFYERTKEINAYYDVKEGYSPNLKDYLSDDKSTNKRFWLSIKLARNCLFSRRNGYKGKILFGYSVRLRLFGRNLI